jgi:LysR family hydrogen peroxide-inducible transcriptional activator
MELRDIRYFLALSEELNFTRAANTCGVSQPALTRAIQKMENELGGLLFSRERGNTHMTDLGLLVSPHLCGAISHISAARQVAERFLNLEDAQLTVGVMRTLEPTQFVSLLRSFRSSHPGVDVSFCQSNTERLCDLLLKGKLHLALLSLPDELPSSLQAMKLYSEPYVMACSPDHRFTEQEIVSGTDLTGEVYISQPDTRLDPVMRDPCLRQGIKLLKSNDEEGEDWVVTMVAAGFGVSLVPAYTASHPEVIYLPFAPPLLSRDISLVTVAGRRWSPVTAAFVNLVRRHQWAQARGCYGHRIKSTALVNMRQTN